MERSIDRGFVGGVGVAGCTQAPSYHEGREGRLQEAAPRPPGLSEAYSALQSALVDAEDIASVLDKRLEPVSRPVPRGNEVAGATPMPPVSPLAQALLAIASRIRMVTERLREAERNLDT